MSVSLTLIPLNSLGELERPDALTLVELNISNTYFHAEIDGLVEQCGRTVPDVFSIWSEELQDSRRMDGCNNGFRWLPAGEIGKIRVLVPDERSSGALGYLRAIKPHTPVILDWIK